MNETYPGPCPYVATKDYDWSYAVPYSPPEGCPQLPFNPLVFCFDAAIQACTIYCGLELNIQLLLRFKKKKSIYFWSILTSLWGGLLFTTAVLIQHYTSTHYLLSTIIIDIGWVAMVTGFSFVLYSRLHLLKPNKMLLRVALCCIIINGVLFHVPVLVTTLMGNVSSKPIIGRIYAITSFMEVVFSVQETVLASTYIYLFLRYTKDSRSAPETKRTLYLLIGAECAVLSTDLILNVLLYTEFYLARTIIQAFMSMLKLKVEFIVLNSLVKFATANSSRPVADLWLAPIETPETPKLRSGVDIRSLSRHDTLIPGSPVGGIGADKQYFSSSGGISLRPRESV